MKQPRYLRLMALVLLLSIVLASCGNPAAAPEPPESESASTTTTTTMVVEATTTEATIATTETRHTTTTTESTTTTEATTTSKPTKTTTATTEATVPTEPPEHMEFLWEGKMVRLDFKAHYESVAYIPIRLEVDIVAVPEEEKENGEWVYTTELADGRTIRCDVLPKSGEIYRLGVYASGHPRKGSNDPQAVMKAVKGFLKDLGCDHREEDIHISMKGEKAQHLGYFADVVLKNKKDGRAFMNVRNQKGYGWQIVEMYLDVGHPLRKVKWG